MARRDRLRLRRTWNGAATIEARANPWTPSRASRAASCFRGSPYVTSRVLPAFQQRFTGVLAGIPADLTSRMEHEMKTKTTKTKSPRPFRNFPDAIDEILS